MSNCFLAFNNRADEAVLAGGAWSVTMPLDNLQDRLLSKPARSTDATLASTQFTIALAQARPVRAIVLARHNLDLQGKYRLTAYSDAGLTVQEYDSGWQSAFPAMFDTTSLEWEDDNWWAGTISEEERAGYFWSVIHLLPAVVFQRYWKVEIDNTTNPDGYIDVGRLFIANGWTPAYNMSYGQSVKWESRDEIEEAIDGTEYFDERPGYRVERFTLNYLTESEAMALALDMQRLAGITREVLFVYDPADSLHFYRRSFLGRVRQLSPIEQVHYNIHSTAYEIKELL